MRDRLRRIPGSLLAALADLTRDEWLLAAVSGKKSLAIRVKHILEGPRSSPRSGRLWTAFAATAATLCVVGLALAQARPESTMRDREKSEPQGQGKTRSDRPFLLAGPSTGP